MPQIFAVILLALLATGCGDPAVIDVPQDGTVEIVNDSSDPPLDSGGEFACELYAKLAAGQRANLFISPYSIRTALAMTYAGAAGETQAEMSKTLHFTQPGAALHEALHRLQTSIDAAARNNDARLNVANRIWTERSFRLEPKFLALLQRDYGAEPGMVEFEQHPDAARKTINDWVAKQTQNKIVDLLAPGVVNTDTRMILTNAIYFRAPWTIEFFEANTKDEPFIKASGEKVDAPLMHRGGHYRYGEAEGLQILELAYGPSQQESMVFLLPRKPDGLPAVEKTLTDDSLKRLIGSLKPRLVDVQIPRFKLTASFELREVLQSLGMKQAFDPQLANFSQMADQRLFLSAVIHQAYLDVNEQGTEAAAATAPVARAAAKRPGEPEVPVVFRADHPFVFLIRDNATGTILFFGRLMEPKG